MTIARSSGLQVAAIAAIGCYSAGFALLPTPAARLALAAPIAALALLWWMFSGVQRWIAMLLAFATLLPPLPLPLGDSGPHPAMLVALAGILIGFARLHEWRFSFDAVTASLCGLFLILLASGGAALIYSGPSIASGTIARVALFGIGVYVFLYTAHGPAWQGATLGPALRCLFLMAILAAAFACVDFYYQFPAPAGFSQQFVWLDTGVFRRAQGLYYDASTLGNFCAFFLLLAASGLTDRFVLPNSKALLLTGGAILSTALVLSYSRASLLNVLAGIVTLAALKRSRAGRIVATLLLAAAAALAIVWFSFPAFAESYWIRLSASLQYFWSSPEGVLSGRVASWRTLAEFLLSHPWHAVFGIGYKTLPYSTVLGGGVIADNMYLSLLVETGLIGLVSFLLFSGAVLRAGFRAARHPAPETRFLGALIACFWIGQMVQMLSGDLLTYWRVLPIYFWVLGVVVRQMKGNAAGANSGARSV